MKKSVEYPLAIVITFLWIGFVCAISFMEAWLKFRAPGITLPLGLGIGRLVFDALNKVEWVFILAIVFQFLIAKAKFLSLKMIPFYLAAILVIIQSIWLLPALDTRAEMHIQGLAVLPSNLHFYYVGFEAIKTISLTIFGIRLFK